MAYSSNRNKKINTQYFQDLTETYKKSIQTKDTTITERRIIDTRYIIRNFY